MGSLEGLLLHHTVMWSKVKSKGYRLRCSNWCCYHPLHECEKPFMLLLLPFTSSLRRLGSSCVGSFLRDCWIDPRALFKLSSLFLDAFFVVSWIGTHNFLIFVFCFPEFVDEFKFVPLFFESLLLPYFWEFGSNDCSGWQLAVDFIALNNLLNQEPYSLSSWNRVIPDPAFIFIAAFLQIPMQWLNFSLVCFASYSNTSSRAWHCSFNFLITFS